MNAEQLAEMGRALMSEVVVHKADFVLEHMAVGDTLTMTLQGHAADTPRLIGSRASTFWAFAKIMAAAGKRSGIEVVVAPVKEAVVGVGEKERFEFKARKDWPEERIVALLRRVCDEAIGQTDEIQVRSEAGSEITAVVVTLRKRNLEIEGHVSKLFTVVGRANGRLLIVGFRQSEIDERIERRQPKSAAGRNAGEI